ncbi:MAG: hypothetical protein E7016_05880 [Alphaproteobacteria bacterium]|nr:hypothetical protein [Alphaproteobacteria bacterium]
MRKYFLLSAVVVFIANNANALSASKGEFSASASISAMLELDCPQGMILDVASSDVSKELKAVVDTMSNVVVTTDTTYIASAKSAYCTTSGNIFSSPENFSVLNNVYNFTYMGPEDETYVSSNATISDFTFRISNAGKTVYIGATYRFPENSGVGSYLVQIPVIYTYE